MTKIIVRQLIWQNWTVEHIKKHNVTIEEAETAVKSIIVNKRGYNGRYVLTGRSGTRILSVIVFRKKIGEYIVVTARDADKKERLKVYAKEKDRPNS